MHDLNPFCEIRESNRTIQVLQFYVHCISAKYHSVRLHTHEGETFGRLWFRSMQGNARQSWILDSTSWIPDSSLRQCNLDSEFQLLVGFRIPWAGFWIPWAGFQFLWAGFRILWAGFRIPWAGFRIPKPRIPDSTSKKFPCFRNPDSLNCGDLVWTGVDSSWET